jgi:hypothetical protein
MTFDQISETGGPPAPKAVFADRTAGDPDRSVADSIFLLDSVCGVKKAGEESWHERYGPTRSPTV